MDLTTRDVHRSLGYLIALDRHGYQPTARELNAYADQPDRRPARRENFLVTTFALAASTIARQFMEREVEPAEDMAAHFVRLHWADSVGDRLYVSPLGRALHEALEEQSLEPDTVLDVVLESTDATALARVVGRIGQSGSALLVEPYFRLDHLMTIIEYTEVTRVLASERTTENDRKTLKLGVEKLVLGRQFEVRVASREVHDRYVIPDRGRVQFIGASLNSLGQVATAMGTVNDGADEIRRLYESIWDDSPVLSRAQQAAAPAAPAATPAPAPPAKKATPARKKSGS